MNEPIADMSFAQLAGILAGLLVLAVAVFYAMLFVFAELTGWRKMAGRYRDVEQEATPYRAGSAVVGAQAWTSPPLLVGVDDTGITLRPSRPFRPIFATLHIPWDEVLRAERKQWMFLDVLELHCGPEPEVLVGLLPSVAADVIQARLGAHVAAAD